MTKTCTDLWGAGAYLFACQIALVANQHFVGLLVGVAIDFIHPLFDFVEALLVGNIIHDDDAMRSAIILQIDTKSTHYNTFSSALNARLRDSPSMALRKQRAAESEFIQPASSFGPRGLWMQGGNMTIF